MYSRQAMSSLAPIDGRHARRAAASAYGFLEGIKRDGFRNNVWCLMDQNSWRAVFGKSRAARHINTLIGGRSETQESR